MSRQQTRSSGDGAIDPSLVQKKRARHRLVGAVFLCLVAAAVVPMVLESEPRPRRDVPLEIAGSSKPTAQPAATSAGAAAGSAPAPGNSPATSQSAVRTITPPALSAAPGGPAGAGAPSVSPRDPIPLPKPDAALDAKAAARADIRTERADARTAPAAAAKPESKAESRPDAKALAKAESKNDSKAESKGDPKPDSRVESKTGAGAAPARSAEPDVLAKLIDRATQSSSAAKPEESASRGGGNNAAEPAASRRFLVQIGAFSNVQSARNVSDRAVQAGLRPYQETVKTAQGDWIRVRVGPFSSREDAERAQQDLKRAGVTAAIIAL
ncbi:MAG: SPOR domain-containing protein [Lautropia sp.]